MAVMQRYAILTDEAAVALKLSREWNMKQTKLKQRIGRNRDCTKRKKQAEGLQAHKLNHLWRVSKFTLSVVWGFSCFQFGFQSIQRSTSQQESNNE